MTPRPPIEHHGAAREAGEPENTGGWVIIVATIAIILIGGFLGIAARVWG
jgi:hypothetical protein